MEDFLEKEITKPIVVNIPNEDTFIAPGILCTKDALYKAYTDKVGTTFNFLGVAKKVVDVQKTNDYIILYLE